MSLVKQIALTLNIVVPLYFFFYQLLQQYQQHQSIFIHIIKASILLLSPIFHILALLTPSYCYKNHCPPPHHCHQSQSQFKYPHIKQLKDIHFPQNQYPSQPYIQPKHIQFHQDLIQQSIASSKDEVNKYNKGNKKKDKKKQDNVLRKDQRIQSPPILSKFSLSYQQPKAFNQQIVKTPKNQQKSRQQRFTYDENNINNNNNVNEFSNIPFFGRLSRKSLSNMANSQSPRYSRKSIVQVAQPASIVQPLIKLTPIKNTESSKYNIDYSNKKQYNRSGQQYDIQLSQSHSNQYTHQPTIQCQFCEQCQIPKYLRMKHCYRCSKCVHKYDHHCVLLNICIGQRNQKYYIAFLYAHFYNTCIVLMYLLRGIKDNVQIDLLTGIQTIDKYYVFKAVCIILLGLNFVLTIYLLFIHTRFLFNGLTTYQKQRKPTINYYKHIKKNYLFYQSLKHFTKQEIQEYHPFNQGLIKNAFKVVTASKQPIDWKLPFQKANQIMVEMKDCKELSQNKNHNTKQNVKHDFHTYNQRSAYQWGQQSQSSNYHHAGKTTKSRQSALTKNKDIQEKHQQNHICR